MPLACWKGVEPLRLKVFGNERVETLLIVVGDELLHHRMAVGIAHVGQHLATKRSLANGRAHQAVIDEDASELVADRLVDQHGGDRRIDPAGQAADHPALADPGPDRRARLGAERRHRPVAVQPGDFMDEIGDEPGAVRGMDDLGVEHQAVIASRLVGDQRMRRVGGDADRPEIPGAAG